MFLIIALPIAGNAIAEATDPQTPAAAAPTTANPSAVAAAASTGFLNPGDVAVTGFSGTMLAADSLPVGVEPVDRTLIDPKAPSLRIFDVSSLGGAPAGVVIAPAIRLDVPAEQIGQVFAMTFDTGAEGAPPNLYVAASSAYGLNVVGSALAPDGKAVRLKTGAPDAVFMDGQFGSLSTGSPSAIYKINGATGAASYFADTAFSGTINSGPGIGGLAFDPASRSLYASDLDTGLVHRFGLDNNAALLDHYDHGVAGRSAKGLASVPDDGKKLRLLEPDFKTDDPTTWGFTQPARRIDALAVHGGRLYYAVAEGPAIWSVGLNGGAFGEDARLELKVKAQKPYPVTGITFDGSGRMYLAQRAPTKGAYDYGAFTDGGAEVLRYAPESPDDPATPDLWSADPATYAVGVADDNRAAGGGVSLQYGYKPDGGIDTAACGSTIAMTSDALTAAGAAGLQLNSLDLVRPANVPPSQSTFIDYDQREAGQSARGHVGSVLAFRTCGADAGFPAVAGGETFPPVEDGGATSGGGEVPPVDAGGAGGGGEAFPPVDEGGAAGGGEAFPPVDEGAAGGGEAFPPVDEGGAAGEGEAFPPVEDGDAGTTEAGGVTITKTAGPDQCTADGGCTFNIEVTNNSGKELQDFVLTDDLTAGAADLSGVKIQGVPPPPWKCTTPPNFGCTHVGAIPDGGKVTLPLTFKPTGIGQEKQLQNCASPQAPGAAQAPAPAPALAPVPAPKVAEKDGFKFEMIPLSASCTAADGQCEWELKVTNTSAAEKKGTLVISASPSIGSDGVAADKRRILESKTSTADGLPCHTLPRNFTIQCGNNMTLKPGQTVSAKLNLKLEVKPGDPAFVHNFATLSFNKAVIGQASSAIPLKGEGGAGADADGAGGAGAEADGAGGAEGQNPADGAAAAAPACAKLPVEAPTPTQAGDISILKKTGFCEGDTTCFNDLEIKNSGNADFDGTIEFDDIITGSDGAAIVPNFLGNGPLICDGAGKCSMKIKIKAGQTINDQIHANFEPRLGAGQKVKNCIRLKGAATESCAVAVTEQPPSKAGPLSLSKFAGTCTDNRTCTFKIDISKDDTAFDGTIEFDDVLTGDLAAVNGATITSSMPEMSCTAAAQGAKCSGKFKLAENIGRIPTIVLTVTLPPGSTIKELENCATLKGAPTASCTTALTKGDAQPPPPGPQVGAKLTVTKTGPAECSDLGGCDFKIEIKNEGDAPFNGPVVVNEEVTLDGKAAPDALIVPDVLYTCTPGGKSTCTSSPLTIIEPQETATLRVHVVFTKPTGAKVMQNCASVVGAAAKPCVSANLLQGPKLLLMKDGFKSVCDPACAFRIIAKNIGNADLKGPIKIVDFPSNIKSNSGATDIKAEVASVTVVDSPVKVTCTKPGNIWCDIAVDRLPPGAEIAFDLVTIVGVTDFTGDNCVLPRDALAGTVPQVCSPMQGMKPRGPNLLIEKRNASPGTKGADHCELKKECLFIIRVTNTGQKDFVGPIKITDTISLGAPELLEEGPGGNVGWNCTKAGAGGVGAASIDCTIPGAPSPIKPGTFGPLAPGKFIELGISVKPGKTWKTSNILENCADLVDAPAGMGPTHSCASQKLDPFKLSIEKTGDQSCKPGAECKFDLNIFNNEQIVHDDPVTVVDNLSGLSSAEIVSITPVGGAQPFPCKPQPTKVPFNCTGHMKLEPGDKNHYTVVLRLPADASAASFSNCATVGDGATEDIPRSERDGHQSPESCHTVTTSEPTPEPNPDLPTEPEPLQCKGGMILSPKGECACPANTRWNGRECFAGEGGSNTVGPQLPPSAPPPIGCAPGTQLINGVCQKPKCPNGMFGTWPKCCPNGSRFDGAKCVVTKNTGPGDGGASTVQPGRDTTEPEPCRRGTTRIGGVCRPPKCPEGMFGTWPKCCPIGSRFDGQKCVVTRDTGPGEGGASTVRPGRDTTKPEPCRRGTTRIGGVCRPPKCPDGMFGDWPKCCPNGTKFEGGRCVRPGTGGGGASTSKSGEDPGTKCPSGTIGHFPRCRCPAGMNGRPPNCCPDGTTFRDGACRKPRSEGSGTVDTGPRCPAGTFGKPPNCKCPLGMTGSPPNCCPPGTRFENGKCVRPKSTVPCTGGRIGTPPNCSCPPGTHWARSERCLPDAPSKTTPTPSKTEPAKGKCTGGRRGTPPNCYCIPPSKFFGGRCRLPTPAPQQKNDDKVIVK